MHSPVEHVRRSARGKDILQRVKRNTGLEHWNVICRIAFCRSLNNTSPPLIFTKHSDCALEIEWKIFVGKYHDEFLSCFMIRAKQDGIDLTQKDDVAGYFRSHLERGIDSMKNFQLADCLTTASLSSKTDFRGSDK